MVQQQTQATFQLISDEHNSLFDKTFLTYQSFSSDYSRVREYALHILDEALIESEEKELLVQQISEMIKNAIKHGNNCDTSKNIHIWYSFSSSFAHFIIEDEGDGFTELENWNIFNQNRIELIENKDYEQLGNFVSFKTQKSDEHDGGNALFAALEYWNEGIYLNDKRNALAMYRTFPSTI